MILGDPARVWGDPAGGGGREKAGIRSPNPETPGSL